MTEISPVSAGPAGAGFGAGPRFYRHSGRAPMNALMAGLMAAVIGGAVAGGTWGFLELYLHLAPAKLQIAGFLFGVAGLGMWLGYFPTMVLMRFKGRSPWGMAVCTLVALAAAYYAAWVFFTYALELYSVTGRPLWDVARPAAVVEDMTAYYSGGVWHFLDEEWMPKGIYLAMFWLAELLTLLTLALRTGMKRLNKRTFCEHCDTWGTSRPITEISDENWGELKKSLQAGDVDSLNAAKGRAYAVPSWCDVTIEGCPTCDNVQTLTVTRTVVTQNKKGKASKKTRDLVRRLVLTPEQTVQVAVIAAGLKGAESGKDAEF